MDWLQAARDSFDAGDPQGLATAQTAALIAIGETLTAILGAIVTIEPDAEGWRGTS